MTTVTVVRKDGRIREVTVKGHSGYAVYGKDIVCAAISATVQTALMGIIKYSSTDVEYTVNEEVGFIRFSVPESIGEEQIRVDAIAETMLLGVKDIESGYGTYVKVEVK